METKGKMFLKRWLIDLWLLSLNILFFSSNPDPTIRDTFWSLSIGGALTAMPLWTVSQISVQRYMSVSFVSLARRWAFDQLPFPLFNSPDILCDLTVLKSRWLLKLEPLSTLRWGSLPSISREKLDNYTFYRDELYQNINFKKISRVIHWSKVLNHLTEL